MAANLNRMMAIGRLGRDTEVRHSQSGQAMATINVAVDDTWRDKKTGEKKSACEWIRCILLGQQAEYAGQYAQKGSLVYVEGKMQTRKWQDKQGQDRYTTEVIVRNFQLLGSKPKVDASPQQYSAGGAPNHVSDEYSPSGQFDPDEVPF